MLDAAAIIHTAERRVGIVDSDLAVGKNLHRLVESLNRDGELSAAGEFLTHELFVMDAVNRLKGLRWLRDCPEIADEPIVSPVFLMGLPRSGTTYFQYLFDRDPRFRLIRTWQSMAPHPPPGFDPGSVATRRAAWKESRKAQPSFEGFDALHLYDQDGSDECHAFLQQSYGAAGLHNLFRIPEYFDYLLDELDLAETYRIHKRQLQLLQWRLDPKPWALKYPNHIIAMNEILQVYPDARFLMTHRDPAQVVASISKMTVNLRGLRRAHAVDPLQVGRDMQHFIRRHVDRVMEFDRDARGSCVVHVDYYALVADPVAEMRRIHAGLGIDTPEEVLRSVDAWHRANPKNARGANDYSLRQYGLDADALADLFNDYIRRFDIPQERQGLARMR
jgi:Sulfotransferase family